MVYKLRPRSSPSPSSRAELQTKLLRVVRRHERMKSAFNDLKSQIKTGLIEAEDVFASLSIPLMKLVGLKTREMAEEGRFSTFIIESQKSQVDVFESERKRSSSSRRHQIQTFKEGVYYSRASRTGKELVKNQQSQLQQLVHLLRQIESQVNSHQENILQTLDNHQVSLQQLFQKAVVSLSSFQQTTSSNEAFLRVTVKLLRVLFNHVNAALGSAQCGVEDLIRKLAENMCCPMVEYVKGLREEMGMGKLMSLVSVVQEMEELVRDGQLELEEAKRRLKEEEERKLEAMTRLKEAEGKRGNMKKFVGFLLEAKKGSKEALASHKLLTTGADRFEDERLLWDLLKEKNNVQAQASPLGTKQFLHAEPLKLYQRTKGNSKSSPRIEPIVSHRPVTRSRMLQSGPPTPEPDTWPRLGSSPSVANQKEVLQKQLSPVVRLPTRTFVSSKIHNHSAI